MNFIHNPSVRYEFRCFQVLRENYICKISLKGCVSVAKIKQIKLRHSAKKKINNRSAQKRKRRKKEFSNKNDKFRSLLKIPLPSKGCVHLQFWQDFGWRNLYCDIPTENGYRQAFIRLVSGQRRDSRMENRLGWTFSNRWKKSSTCNLWNCDLEKLIVKLNSLTSHDSGRLHIRSISQSNLVDDVSVKLWKWFFGFCPGLWTTIKVGEF